MPQLPEPRLVPVAEGVHAWIGAGGDSNAGAIETPDGLIVIDAQQTARLAGQFRDALLAATASPIRTVVNTHCHLDHTAGNIVFADAPILAHAKALRAMEQSLGPRAGRDWIVTAWSDKIRFLFGENILDLVPDGDPARQWFEARIAGPDYEVVTVTPPTQTFADTFFFHLPDELVRLAHWGPAHSDNDIVVHLERRRVAFIGDLVFHGRFPWLGDCDLNGWIARLGQLAGLDLGVVVPGHGPPITLREVAEFRQLLLDIRYATEGAIKAGASEEAAVREVQLPQYAAIPRYADWLPLDIRAAYRYLRGEAPRAR